MTGWQLCQESCRDLDPRRRPPQDGDLLRPHTRFDPQLYQEVEHFQTSATLHLIRASILLNFLKRRDQLMFGGLKHQVAFLDLQWLSRERWV